MHSRFWCTFACLLFLLIPQPTIQGGLTRRRKTREFLFRRTSSITQRPCGCSTTFSCSCCETVTLLYSKRQGRLCSNFMYQRNGLNVDISLNTNVLKTTTVSAYRPFKICSPIPGTFFSSICVNVVELNEFPRSLTVCVRHEIATKVQEWQIDYTCVSISTELPAAMSMAMTSGTTAMETMKPATTTMAPAMKTMASAMTMSTMAPAMSTMTPAKSTMAAMSTMAPAMSTMAPAMSTMAPAMSTMAPAMSTMAPAMSSMAAMSTMAPAMSSMAAMSTMAPAMSSMAAMSTMAPSMITMATTMTAMAPAMIVAPSTTGSPRPAMPTSGSPSKGTSPGMIIIGARRKRRGAEKRTKLLRGGDIVNTNDNDRGRIIIDALITTTERTLHVMRDNFDAKNSTSKELTASTVPSTTAENVVIKTLPVHDESRNDSAWNNGAEYYPSRTPPFIAKQIRDGTLLNEDNLKVVELENSPASDKDAVIFPE